MSRSLLVRENNYLRYCEVTAPSKNFSLHLNNLRIHRVRVTQFCFISVAAVLRRHFVGKTPRNFCYCAVALGFVVKSAITLTFSPTKLLQFTSE